MTTLTPPTQETVAAIWSEMRRLGVEMEGWWADFCCEATGEPAYGMQVSLSSLRDWEIDGLIFEWYPGHGWIMNDWCTPQVPREGIVVLDIPDPYGVQAVARHFKAVIDGEIDEFRTVKP